MFQQVTYNPARPSVVADSLEALRGPTEGYVELPIFLDWTPTPRYDLSCEEDIRCLYMTVLNNACSVKDLALYLNHDMLRNQWRKIHLPLQLRLDWEKKHPELISQS